ncbi:SPW repeat domain-containing protein [Aureimonas glaciei]|uniref:SPW repeat domain-containing protein n=1 Tax=Aureimonas glaciei TaxID=1776957 RepID=UPI001FCEAB14|nr:SPW repeat protein [Aureimonas glaciei]
MIDYLYGAVLIGGPFLLGFADGSAAELVPRILGVSVIFFSLFTRYELSLIKLIPMKVHLANDVVSGIFLAASPWLFGFADRIWWPHVLAGVTSIVIPLLTSRNPAVVRQ